MRIITNSVHSFLGSSLVSIYSLMSPSVEAQQNPNQSLGLRFSVEPVIRKIEQSPTEEERNSLFGRFDEKLNDYYADHLGSVYHPDRTPNQFANDFARAGKRAGTEWLKNLPVVHNGIERIEEKANQFFENAKDGVAQFFGGKGKEYSKPIRSIENEPSRNQHPLRIDFVPPRETELYGLMPRSSYRDRYKLKLNISTHPSLEVRFLHSAKLRLYSDEMRISYSKEIVHDIYAQVGVKVPFDEQTVFQPYLRIQKEWDQGEFGIGVRVRNRKETSVANEKVESSEIYGGIFLASHF